MKKAAQETYMQKGLLLEKACHYAFKHLGLENAHNPFDSRYNHGFGVDNTINTSRGNIETECKNVNGKHQLSKAWINEEVLCRFGYKPFVRLLVISILFVSRKVRRLIERNGIRIIELGYQVTSDNFKKTVHNLIKKLYWIKVKYAKIVGKKPSSQQTKLSHFDRSLLYNFIIDVDVVCSVGYGWYCYERVTDGCG